MGALTSALVSRLGYLEPCVPLRSSFLLSPASTRKLYEKRLQKLLDNDPPTSQVILADTKVTSNGSADPELYSDQDDGERLLSPGRLPFRADHPSA